MATYNQYTIAATADGEHFELTHTVSGSVLTVPKGKATADLNTADDHFLIDFHWISLRIYAFDITNLIGGTAAARYSNLLTYL